MIQLWNYFYSDRELIKKLQDGVNEVIRYYYSKGNNRYEVGIIAVVHKNNNWWTSIGHIPFEYLRKS